MVELKGFAAGFVLACLVSGTGLAASPAASGARSAPPAGPAAPGGSGTHEATTRPVSQDAAARSRMHECGHQWSSMKKTGQVGAMTWKEFSATCLAVNR